MTNSLYVKRRYIGIGEAIPSYYNQPQHITKQKRNQENNISLTQTEMMTTANAATTDRLINHNKIDLGI